MALLNFVQRTGLFAVIVRGSKVNKRFFVRMFEVPGLSEDQPREFAGHLSLVGVTLDKYRTNVAPGPKEIALSAMGPGWPLSLQMPYGLVRNETPSFSFAGLDGHGAEHTDDSTKPPEATQDRRQSTLIDDGEMRLSETNSNESEETGTSRD